VTCSLFSMHSTIYRYYCWISQQQKHIKIAFRDLHVHLELGFTLMLCMSSFRPTLGTKREVQQATCQRVKTQAVINKSGTDSRDPYCSYNSLLAPCATRRLNQNWGRSDPPSGSVELGIYKTFFNECELMTLQMLFSPILAYTCFRSKSDVG
jgi:hypothetical protein